MKANEVKIGAVYTAKVSGRVVPVEVLNMYESGGRKIWACRNMDTGRTIEVRSPLRFRKPVVIIEKSKGHIGFLHKKWEFWKADNGDLYRSDITNPVMPDGRRCGRFEATKETAATALRLAIEAARAEREQPCT